MSIIDPNGPAPADGPKKERVVRSVENNSPEWIPMPEVAIGDLAEPYRDYFPRTIGGGHHLGPDLSNPFGPIPRLQGQPGLAPNELRPFERIYYCEGSIPEPPAFGDPRWLVVRDWLGRNMNDGRNGVTSAFDAFCFDTWKDMSINPGGQNASQWRNQDGTFNPRNESFRKMPVDDQATLGYWNRGYRDLYWNPAYMKHIPDYRLIGMTPWAEGPSNDHYAKATWCLENYFVTGDLAAWRQFVLIVLHQAGQGFVHDPNYPARSGMHGLRYEKGPDHWVGSYFPNDADCSWGHYWPEGILLFWFLTGELGDVAWQIIVNLRANMRGGYKGYWGPRIVSRALRALRLLDKLFPGQTEDDRYVETIVHDSLAYAASKGTPYFPNYGLFGGLGIDVWQDWDFMSEIMQWYMFRPGGDDIYGALLPIAEWHLENTTRLDGHIGYKASAQNGKVLSVVHESFNHTAFAVPMLAAMTYHGDLGIDEFRRHVDHVLAFMPKNRNGGRGLLHVTPDGAQHRFWGQAAEKTAAGIMFGMRPDFLNYVGNYGG